MYLFARLRSHCSLLLTDKQRYESGDYAHRMINNGLSFPFILMTTPFKNKKSCRYKEERKKREERKKE
jgi:hypothetical protein